MQTKFLEDWMNSIANISLWNTALLQRDDGKETGPLCLDIRVKLMSKQSVSNITKMLSYVNRYASYIKVQDTIYCY
jgi:hypothetical protein